MVEFFPHACWGTARVEDTLVICQKYLVNEMEQSDRRQSVPVTGKVPSAQSEKDALRYFTSEFSAL